MTRVYSFKLTQLTGSYEQHMSSGNLSELLRIKTTMARANGKYKQLISRKMYEFVLGKLIEKYDDNWWYEGIPNKVRERCAIEYERGQGKKEKEQYLKFLDYQAIAHQEWSLFQEYFTISKEGGKEKKLKWLVKLNDIRNITHHAEKWPAEKEQVQTIRKIHKHVMEKFV